MRVILFRPYWYFLAHDILQTPTEPLALERLAASVGSRHTVKIYDVTIGDKIESIPTTTISRSEHPVTVTKLGVSDATIESLLLEFKPDIVGITSQFFTQQIATTDFTALIRRILPDTPIVIGGINPSSLGADYFNLVPHADILVIGEGEITFQEICDSNLSDLKNIDGIIFKDRYTGQIITTPQRSLVKKLDTLPLPIRDKTTVFHYQAIISPFFRDLDLDLTRIKFLSSISRVFGLRYITVPKNNLLAKFTTLPGVYSLSSKIISFLSGGRIKRNTATIETSRGCPNDCNFCSVKDIWQRKVRLRSISNIMDEIKSLKADYGVSHIRIADDMFNINKKRTIELCAFLKREDITWDPLSGVYLMSLDEEVLRAMLGSGCSRIFIAVESGCDNTLRNIIGKHVDLDYAREIFSICKNLGIYSEAFFIIGLPGETKTGILKTLRYALECGVDYPRIFPAAPFPGTRLYHECIKNGYLDDEIDFSKLQITYHSKIKTNIITTDEFNSDEIHKVREVAIRMYDETGKWEQWEHRLKEAINF